jgi:hypothetical protein
MPGYINSGGVWQEVKNVFVHDGGVWKEAKEGYVNDSGVWRKFFVNSFIYTHTITANTADYNLRNALIAAGWDQVRPVDVTLTIASGVYLFATSTSAYAFTTGFPFPSGSILRLINHGLIVGRGGQGGNGASFNISATPGLSGGPALQAQYPITISNTNIIGGGGGGGGGGGWASASLFDLLITRAGGGGGGGGRGIASGGSGGVNFFRQQNSVIRDNRAPAAGSASLLPGNGGGGLGGYARQESLGSPGAFQTAEGGNGGNGGDLGSHGSQGGVGNASMTFPGQATFSTSIGGSGGAPGNAVVGNSFISWAIVGQRLGPIS